MPLIRVYKYKVYSDEHGAFIDTNVSVWATPEKISSLGAQRIEEQFIDVEESKINNEGFYHQ